MDLSALEGSETDVASQAERGVVTRKHLLRGNDVPVVPRHMSLFNTF